MLDAPPSPHPAARKRTLPKGDLKVVVGIVHADIARADGKIVLSVWRQHCELLDFGAEVVLRYNAHRDLVSALRLAENELAEDHAALVECASSLAMADDGDIRVVPGTVEIGTQPLVDRKKAALDAVRGALALAEATS